MKMGKNVSRFLSLVLRHRPEIIGLTLDKGGWANIDVLIDKLAQHGNVVTREDIVSIVRDNDKKRFSLSEDGNLIKAAQGHSLDVQLELEKKAPPDLLFHGTVAEALPSIERDGLSKMQRHHVHLSKDEETAVKVGSRRGKPIVLTVDAKRMSEDGFEFFISDNGVWLTERVPSEYITFP